MSKKYIGKLSLSSKAKEVLKNQGLKGLAKCSYEYLLNKNKEPKIFEFNNEKYLEFYHWYNTTWRTEDSRKIEIPIILDMIEKSEGNILEIGNVLSHYVPVNSINHTVVDKYEIGSNVINQDACTFDTDKRFNLIVSISTIEHIGFDENPKKFSNVILALKNLRRLLTKEGKLVITIPLGYNQYLDKLILNNKLQFSEKYFMKNINGTWFQYNQKSLGEIKYPGLLFIGIIANGNK